MKRNTIKRYKRRRSRNFRGYRNRGKRSRIYGGLVTNVSYTSARPDPTLKSQSIASAQVNNLADVLNTANNK
jgi:hypothetical protein